MDKGLWRSMVLRDVAWCRAMACCVVQGCGVGCTGHGVVCCVWDYDALWCENIQYGGVAWCAVCGIMMPYGVRIYSTGGGVVCCVWDYDALWCENIQYSCR